MFSPWFASGGLSILKSWRGCVDGWACRRAPCCTLLEPLLDGGPTAEYLVGTLDPNRDTMRARVGSIALDLAAAAFQAGQRGPSTLARLSLHEEESVGCPRPYLQDALMETRRLQRSRTKVGGSKASFAKVAASREERSLRTKLVKMPTSPALIAVTAACSRLHPRNNQRLRSILHLPLHGPQLAHLDHGLRYRGRGTSQNNDEESLHARTATYAKE